LGSVEYLVEVLKHGGSLSEFDKGKIVKTCMTAGCSLDLASRIAGEIESICYPGMPTIEIREKVYGMLCDIDKELAEKYLYRTNLRVRTSDYQLKKFNGQKITDSLVTETLVDEEFASQIAKAVEKELAKLKLDYVTAPLIREIVNVKLLEEGMESVRAKYTRLGMPVYDVKELFRGVGLEGGFCPQRIRDAMAEQIITEYTLLNILPPALADSHLKGDLNIHYIRDFPLKAESFSHPLKIFLEKGLDWNGTETFVLEKPAKTGGDFVRHLRKISYSAGLELSGLQVFPGILELAKKFARKDAEKFVKEMVSELSYASRITESGRVMLSLEDVGDFSKSLVKPLLENSGDANGLVFWIDAKDAQTLRTAVGRKPWGAQIILGKTPAYFEPEMGVAQTVCINLAHAESLEGEVESVQRLLKDAKEILIFKKKMLQENHRKGLWSYLGQMQEGTAVYDPLKQEYVISFCGLESVSEKELGETQVLESMRKYVNSLKKKSGMRFMLKKCGCPECCARFARIDGKRSCKNKVNLLEEFGEVVERWNMISRYADSQSPIEVDGGKASKKIIEACTGLLERGIPIRFV